MSIEYINESEYTFLNGYKSYIQNSGLVYHLDFNSKNNSKITKRVSLFRPLGLLSILRNDVYNSTHFRKKINLLFALRENFNPSLLARLCKQINSLVGFVESVNFLVLKNSQIFELKQKIFIKRAKLTINEITLKDLSLYYNDDYIQLLTIKHFSKLFSDKSLMLYLPVNARFGESILKRVVLNTIFEKQVFFPIAFYYYPFANETSSLLINQENGYFNHISKEVVSFYNLDFIKVDDGKAGSVYDLFKISNLQILHVADNDLKCSWRLFENCHLLNLNDSHKCQQQRQQSFGNDLAFFNSLLKYQ